jgi:hypothetical protein
MKYTFRPTNTKPTHRRLADDVEGILREHADSVTIQPASAMVDLADYALIVVETPAPEVQPEPVPERVRTAALRLALFRLHQIQDGSVYAIINASDLTDAQKTEARIQWEYEPNTRRDHPLVAAFAPAFSLTPAQVDEVFRLADTL